MINQWRGTSGNREWWWETGNRRKWSSRKTDQQKKLISKKKWWSRKRRKSNQRLSTGGYQRAKVVSNHWWSDKSKQEKVISKKKSTKVISYWALFISKHLWSASKSGQQAQVKYKQEWSAEVHSITYGGITTQRWPNLIIEATIPCPAGPSACNWCLKSTSKIVRFAKFSSGWTSITHFQLGHCHFHLGAWIS